MATPLRRNGIIKCCHCKQWKPITQMKRATRLPDNAVTICLICARKEQQEIRNRRKRLYRNLPYYLQPDDNRSFQERMVDIDVKIGYK